MKKHLFRTSDRARRPVGAQPSRLFNGRRFARLEQLEERSLLAAVVGPGTNPGGSNGGPQPIFDSWRNPLAPLDVNNDTRVSAIDALVVINVLNDGGSRQLPPTPGFGIPIGGAGTVVAHAGERASYIDVNGDGRLTPLDALSVINKLNAAAGEQVRIRLVATDVAGNVITSTPVDSDFQIRGFVQDIRTNAEGVFAAYSDIVYNTAVASTDGPITFDPFFANGRSGSTSTDGVVDEIGALAGTLTPPGPSEQLQFIIPFHADTAGVATFTLDPADLLGNDVLVYGSDVPVPTAEIEFVNTLVLVGDFPSVSINDQSITEGDTGEQQMTFTVTLSAPAGLPVTMNYATINGTATSGADFTAGAGTLTFATGETTKTITVPILGDTTQEGNETFTVSLTNVANATVTKANGTGTIIDNEIPPVAVAIGDATVTEGNSGAVNMIFTVTLAEASTAEVSVNFATSDGTAIGAVDYTSLNGTLTFAPGETSKTVSVSIFGDTIFEANETLNVTLSGGLGVLIQDGTGVGTITNDDVAPSISIADVTANEGHNIALNAVFVVSLSAPSGVQVDVNYATVGQTATAGVDFTAVSGTVNFLPGETTKTILVPILSDTIEDAGETFAVNLSNASVGTIVDGTAIGTILDPPDDLVRIRLVATDSTGAPITNVLAGEEFFVEVYVQDRREDPEGVFQAFLDIFYPETIVQADAPIQFGEDYANDRRANLAVPGVIDEAGAADGITPLGPSERLLFRAPFTALSNGVARFVADPADDQVFNQVLVFGSDDPIDPSQVLYEGTVIQVGPPPTVSINDVTIVEGSEAVFTITLSNTTLSDVTVDFTTANGTATAPDDYLAQMGSVTFEAEGALTKEVRIPVVADGIEEEDETFFVQLTGATGVPITDNEGIATILATPPSLSITDVEITEGNSGETEAVFTVTLSKEPELPVTVEYSTVGLSATSGIDFQPANGVLTFAPGETTKTITVIVNGDLADENNEEFEVVLSNQTNALIAKGSGIGTIFDDEITPGSISGYVYFDANANGVRDEGESGLSNVFVDLQGVAFGVPVFQSTITGFDGSYSFQGLQPGRYVISEVQPGFYTDGLDAIGTQGGEVFDDVFHITLGEAIDGLENNFGEGGLRSQFLTKRLFMGSAPTDGAVTGLSVAAGDMWFSFDRGFSLFNVQATSHTSRPVYMTLYDAQMRVIATTTPAGIASLQASGVLGSAYFLRVGGGSVDVSLSFDVVDASPFDQALEDPFLLEVL
jgi:hypothetical protein